MGIQTSQSPGASAQISNFGQKLVVSVDLTSATWNTVATHEVFDVTGLIAGRLFVQCTDGLTDATSASALAVLSEDGASGKPDITNFYKGDAISAGALLLDSGQTGFGEIQSIVHEFVSYQRDIGYSVFGEAFTGGTLDFILYWTPISEGATVVAGAGGSLT